MAKEHNGSTETFLGPFSKNSIIHGDAFNVITKLPAACIDLVVIDPPYGIDYITGHRKYPSDVAVPIVGDDPSFWEKWPMFVQELARVMKDDSGAFIFTRWDQWCNLCVTPLTPQNMIVWDKGNWTAGDLEGNYGYAYELIMFAIKGRPKIRGRRIWNIWRVPRIPAADLRHPSEKPEKLIQIMVRSMSDPGDLVADFFCGSGTTPVVADRLDRKFIAVDFVEKYVKMTAERLAGDRAGRQLVLL